MKSIDADALKKEVALMFGDKTHITESVCELIDNAPTVELFCSYLSDGEVRQPCVEGPCEDERPQGEWKVDGCLIACNMCGRILLKASELYNFCPNCGAIMRGGTI